MSVQPIRRIVRVKADPAHAFALFTQKMGAWWPDKKTIGPAPRADIIVDPVIGGRWYERAADGTETQWGHVLSFDPPKRIILAWQISGQWKFDPDLVTEVEISFTAQGAETEVILEHRHLERLGQDYAHLPSLMDQGWGSILEHYQIFTNVQAGDTAMSDIVIFGVPGSPYVRSLVLTLEEKGLPYQLKNIGMGGTRHPDYLARQPFGKIPAITHGDFTLYETQAMIRYVNRLSPEPNLVPDDPRAEARMNQVIGMSDWYVFPGPSAGIGFHRVVAPKFGLPADEAKIAATIEPARICLSALSAILRDQEFFAGDRVSLADLHLFPHLEFLSLAAPEGPELLAQFPSLTAWLARMQARPSVKATTWEAMTAKAQAA